MESIIVPYFINITIETKINTLTGHANKNELTQRILEDIAEWMTFSSQRKQTTFYENMNIMYFESNWWHTFNIIEEKDNLIRVYEEKQRNFYIESDSDSGSDSDESDIEERWEEMFEQSRKKIYECHKKLMKQLEDDD
jgi:hypothetical protein